MCVKIEQTEKVFYNDYYSVFVAKQEQSKGKQKMKTMTKTTYASELSKERENADGLEFDEYIKSLPRIGTRTEDGKFLYPNGTDPWEWENESNEVQ